jgi:hypothetical protein
MLVDLVLLQGRVARLASEYHHYLILLLFHSLCPLLRGVLGFWGWELSKFTSAE